MNHLLTILLCLASFGVMAADVTVARIWVTAATTNGMSLGWSRGNTVDVRTVATNASATEIEIGTNSVLATTNLYTHLATYPFAGVTVAYSATNGIILTSSPGASFSLSASDGWSTIIVSTQPENLVSDIVGTTVRYRSGSSISLDPTTTIKGEGGGWTLTYEGLEDLAGDLADGNFTANRYKSSSTNAFILSAPDGGSWIITVDSAGSLNVVTNTDAL